MRHFVMIIISFYNREQFKAGLYSLYLAVPPIFTVLFNNHIHYFLERDVIEFWNMVELLGHCMMYKGEIRLRRSKWLPKSSSKPPYNNEEPKDNDGKHDVP